MPRRTATPSTRRRGPGRPAGGQAGEGRDRLLEAARSLMAERGLPRVTVREVAERAGLQPALVNYYFGSKDELLRAVVDHSARLMLARIEASLETEGTPEDRLRAMLRAIVVGMAEEPYAPRLVVEQVLFGSDDVADSFVERFAGRQFALLDGLLGDGRRDGHFRDVDVPFLIPQMLGGAIWFFLSAPVMKRLFGIDEITLDVAERFADQCADVLLYGISRRDGAAT